MANISAQDLHHLLVDALSSSGFSKANAEALARQTVLTEELGQPSVGVAHVFDYIDGIANGRVKGQATPVISRPAPTMIHADAQGGLGQAGFDMAFDDLVASAREFGLAAFLGANSTLCGSLGTFALRLAECGLASLAATNGSPLLAGSGARKAVFCTNPMAFAAPQAGGPPVLIDQSSSATAYVNIRTAAERGEEIPLGWAIDKDGKATTDPKAALEGTLLAFGGARGANIALMVDILAGGLTGANWSLDAPSFFDGDACPGTGLFVLAINPEPIDPNFSTRMATQVARLSGKYEVHIPGLAKGKRRSVAASEGLEIDEVHLARLRAIAATV